MKFASFLIDRLPGIEDPHDVILSLTQRLREAGFGEDALHNVGRLYSYPLARSSIHGVLQEISGDDPFSVMARLWSLSLLVERGLVEKVLTPALVERLLTWGLLATSGDMLGATLDLYPCLGVYLATDHGMVVGSGERPEPVYPLGTDSYSLARMAPRRPFMWGVDMCTGSGVHAILAARHCQRVEAVDLSPRALDFALFNADLNGVTARCGFWKGNLFEALPPGRFDLIVSNPPWVPTPDPTALYRGGGLSGEDLTSRIVTAFKDRLRVGGVAAIYHEYPQYVGQTFVGRVREWLGPGPWGVALVNLTHQTAAQYALAHASTHPPEHVEADFERWLASYQEQGIVGMSCAMLYVLRLPGEQSDWDVVREAQSPQQDQPWVAPWLDSLARLHARPERLAEARLQRGPGRIWFDLDGDEARAEWPDTCLTALTLNPDETRLARQCDGQRSLTELAGELKLDLPKLLGIARHLVEQDVLKL